VSRYSVEYLITVCHRTQAWINSPLSPTRLSIFKAGAHRAGCQKSLARVHDHATADSFSNRTLHPVFRLYLARPERDRVSWRLIEQHRRFPRSPPPKRDFAHLRRRNAADSDDPFDRIRDRQAAYPKNLALGFAIPQIGEMESANPGRRVAAPDNCTFVVPPVFATVRTPARCCSPVQLLLRFGLTPRVWTWERRHSFSCRNLNCADEANYWIWCVPPPERLMH
jgi:hypothetical protein